MAIDATGNDMVESWTISGWVCQIKTQVLDISVRCRCSGRGTIYAAVSRCERKWEGVVFVNPLRAGMEAIMDLRCLGATGCE